MGKIKTTTKNRLISIITYYHTELYSEFEKKQQQQSYIYSPWTHGDWRMCEHLYRELTYKLIGIYEKAH